MFQYLWHIKTLWCTYSFLAFRVPWWGNLYFLLSLSLSSGQTCSSTPRCVKWPKSLWAVMQSTSTPSKLNFATTPLTSLQHRNSNGLFNNSLLQWPRLHLWKNNITHLYFFFQELFKFQIKQKLLKKDLTQAFTFKHGIF